MKLYQVRETRKNEFGLKTTVSVKTEDEAIIRRLLDGSENRRTTDFVYDEPKEEPAAPSSSKKLSLKQPQKKTYEVAPLPQEKKNPNTGSRSGTIKLSRKPINGKGTIVHHTRNLDKKQIEWANHNSFDGNRGTLDAKSYEAYRKEIEFSGLSITQKKKLLDKLYKLYEPILRYDSQYYSVMVSGPAKYPQSKMESILNRRMEALSKFLDWWHSIETQIQNSKQSAKEKKKKEDESKQIQLKKIIEGFERHYQAAKARLKELEKKNQADQIKYLPEVALAQSYINKALKIDTNLYKELFEKLNSLVQYRKNSNVYKIYNEVVEGKITNEKLQKNQEEANKVLYENADYKIQKITIKAGPRIAIKFTFYPKPQLVYALKRRGYVWYSYEECFLCKPEKFDLNWAKEISKNYAKYL